MTTQTHEPDDDLEPELKQKLDRVREAAWWPIGVLGLIVLVVWCLGFIPWFLQEKEWPWKLHWGLENAGVFGDSFGFINSLMSSLALVGVIAAIWLQKQELVEQRKELIITQWELKKSAVAQQASQKELAKQARINLQATVLAALDGIAKAAENQQLYPGDEGPAAVAFVNEMRYVVIFDILGDDGTQDRSPFLMEALDRWRKLSSQIAICNEIVVRATQFVELAHRKSSHEFKPVLFDGDFPEATREEFQQLILKKGEELSKLGAATVDENLVNKLNGLAETMQQDTKDKLDRVIETSNWHSEACRKSRTALFTSGNQKK